MTWHGDRLRLEQGNIIFNVYKKKIGRNPKCDHDWIKVQRKNGNKSTKRKGKIKVQRKKGNRSPNREGK